VSLAEFGLQRFAARSDTKLQSMVVPLIRKSLRIFVVIVGALVIHMEHAQRFNLRLVEEFNRAGIQFAFPSSTVYLAGTGKEGDVRSTTKGSPAGSR